MIKPPLQRTTAISTTKTTSQQLIELNSIENSLYLNFLLNPVYW